MLYLQPHMGIWIRGVRVRPKLIERTLTFTAVDKYRPKAGSVRATHAASAHPHALAHFDRGAAPGVCTLIFCRPTSRLSLDSPSNESTTESCSTTRTD